MGRNRILVITTHISPTRGFGGPSVSIRKFVDYLYNYDLDFKVISTTNERSFVTRNEIYFRSFIFLKLGFSLKLLFFIVQNLRNYNYVIVNGIATWPNLLGILFALIYNKKIIIFSRGSFEMSRYTNSSFLKKLYYKLNFNLICRSHNRGNLNVIYQSRFECLKSCNHFNFKHLIVPNYSESEILLIRSLSSRKKDVDLIYCGRDSFEKGTDRLVEFLRFINCVTDKLTIYVLIDGISNYLDSFAVEESHHRIVLLYSQHQEVVLEIMTKAKFYFFGSRIENFGNSFVEAIACGTIPIMFDDTDWKYLCEKSYAIRIEDFSNYIENYKSFPAYNPEQNEILFDSVLSDHFKTANNYSEIIEICNAI